METEPGLDAHALGDSDSPFDVAIPVKPDRISARPNRIIYKTIAGTEFVLELTTQNDYHNAIFQAIASGISSDWFAGLTATTKESYYHNIRYFVEWLSRASSQRTALNRYECLNDYEGFVSIERRVKHSQLSKLKCIIEHGSRNTSLSRSDSIYLDKLLRLSKPARPAEPESYTLTQWFNLPWLRSLLGEEAYCQLESPHRLMLSFRITVAVTLDYLLESRHQWQKRSAPQLISTNGLKWWLNWNRQLIGSVAKFDSQGNPVDTASQVIWLDVVNASVQDRAKALIASRGASKLPKFDSLSAARGALWQQPVLFHPDYRNCYSPLEERLAAWLAACEAIQSTDIKKLKSSDYAKEFNTGGRLLMMQSQYYKGRSGSFQQPSLLMGSDCWTQAFYKYMQGLPDQGVLFKTAIDKQRSFPSLGPHAKRNSDMNLLIKIWQIPELRRGINDELKRNGASAIFLKAMLALEKGSPSINTFRREPGFAIRSYKSAVERPLPGYLFALAHVKTTAVHAGSDRYRDSDLVNHHSHTSLTEKSSYLTDANKDWVNQCGRVTRLVLHDLQNVVYQPSLDLIQQEVRDLDARTTVAEFTGELDPKLGRINGSVPFDHDEMNLIVVPDTMENALYFIHFIRQAEEALPKLLKVRPDYVERTLMVQVEWMTRTLMRMQQARAAEKQYVVLSAHLPQMFDHLFETGE